MNKRRERGGCLGRLVGLVAAAALVAAPIGLALPDDVVTGVLALVFPGDGWDFSSPDLLATWRWLLACSAGVVAAAVGTVAVGLARRARRRRAVRDVPGSRLAKAVRQGDMEAVRACAEQLGAEGGAESVPALMAALEAPLDDEARRAVAAALYRLGRAVTAEVSPRPRRM